MSYWKTVGGIALVAAGAAAGVAVSGQPRDTVGQAREVQPPRMIVANRATEPVPVTVANKATEPVAVTVANKATEPANVSAVIGRVADGVRIELGPDTIANLKDNAVVRLARVEWEYKELRLPTAPINYQSILGQLRQSGAEGWETTGVQFSDAGATVVILKRAKAPG